MSIFAVPNGSLAQLVQSICLTSRGSGVRIPQLPQRNKTLHRSHSEEWLLLYMRDRENLFPICPAYATKWVVRCTTSIVMFYFLWESREQRAARNAVEQSEVNPSTKNQSL